MEKEEKRKKQNLVSEGVFANQNLRDRIEEIVEIIEKRTDFEPIKLLGTSAWWGSKKIGAFHYSGRYKGKKAILKVQGVKPTTSEIFMIKEFKRQNNSQLIRPPYLYESLAWNERDKFEALVLEDVGNKLLVSQPAKKEELAKFFKVFKEYRKNCRNEPWLDKPELTIGEKIKQDFDKWIKMSKEIYPEHKLRNRADKETINKAVRTLAKGYQGVSWEFQHGHVSVNDFFKVDKQIVVLSNLYWSWRAPFYDLVFAYHWFILALNGIKGIGVKEIEDQREIWLEKIKEAGQIDSKEKQRLLDLALLERAAAALNIDCLSSDPSKENSQYLMETTREKVKRLTAKLEKNN